MANDGYEDHKIILLKFTTKTGLAGLYTGQLKTISEASLKTSNTKQATPKVRQPKEAPYPSRPKYKDLTVQCQAKKAPCV